MGTVTLIKNEIQGVADMLVHEVLEEVENLQCTEREVPDHHMDGIAEEISMQWDRLRFHRVKLSIPDMLSDDLNNLVEALAKELWAKEVNRLLDLYASQDPGYPINYRL